MENRLLPVCLLCNSTPAGGFSEGIFINRRFICKNCEQTIVGTDIHDHYKYHSIIKGLRKIWF